ncbi:MAG: TolC family protein [Calditrichaeota bacterium]|nr:MAG: TolC family protein [Calditrichota bacterium]
MSTLAEFFQKLKFLLLLAPLMLRSQTALTVEECLREAFKSNNLLRMADINIQIAQEKAAQSENQRMPSLNAKGAFLRFGKISSFSIPMGPAGAMQEFKFGALNRINGDISMMMPLMTWGRINTQIKMANLNIEISRLDRRQRAIEVSDQVLRAAYSVLISREVIAANKIQCDRAHKNLESTEKRFSSGHAAKLEKLRAEVQATNAVTMLDDAVNSYEKSTIWLAKVVGREGEQLSIQGELIFRSATVDIDSLIDRALAQRLDLQILRLQQILLERQSEITEKTLRPSLTGLASYSVQNGFSPLAPEEFVDNWNIGVQLSFPLFDGGITSHRVQETLHQISSFQLQEREIKETISVQIRQSALSLQQAEQKYWLQQKNGDLAREALESAEQQYAQGLISSLDLITAEQALAESELMVLRALYTHTIAKLDLCRAVGDYTLYDLIPTGVESSY